MGEESRSFVTRRMLDPYANPPRYVDEEVPVRSIKLQGAEGRVYERGPHGTALGSLRLTGSFHELAPGSNSVRITRLSLGVVAPNTLGVGTPDFGLGTAYRWHVRHSREGTVDIRLFHESGRLEERGDAMAPIYSFGPGTVTWGWLGDHLGQMGSRVGFSQSLEGLLG